MIYALELILWLFVCGIGFLVYRKLVNSLWLSNILRDLDAPDSQEVVSDIVKADEAADRAVFETRQAIRRGRTSIREINTIKKGKK